MRKFLFIIALLILILCSCTTTKVVEVPVEVTRTEYIHNTKVDSIFYRDSIDRYIRGDTVFLYKERTRYKYINRVDTVIKTDTIPKIVKQEVIKEVEVNHIKWYQETLMWIGGVAFLIFVGYLIYKIKLK